MTETAGPKHSLLEQYKALSTKQLIGTIAAIVIAIVLEVLGLGLSCFGFLIIAVVLYMIPHLLGVSSVKVKALVGVVFILAATVTGCFAYSDIPQQYGELIDMDTDDVRDVVYEDGAITATLVPEGTDWTAQVTYGATAAISFGSIRNLTDQTDVPMAPVEGSPDRYSAAVNLDDGKLYYVAIQILDAEGDVDATFGFTVDTGISWGDLAKLNLYGALIAVLLSAFLFYIILVFSALMRRSAGKTRARMEADGRLYPQGYGRCKECGGMVLPGEINCRKCGAYIDVPEELRAKKKDYFVCDSCGAEVPEDATECPRCGAKFFVCDACGVEIPDGADHCPNCGARFDGAVETEIVHMDGTVDTSTETFECSECGAEVPANAERCPNCGARFDED